MMSQTFVQSLPHILLSPLLPLSFHPSLSRPLCLSLARSLSLNFLLFLYLISNPDPSCLSSLCLSLSFSAACSAVSLFLPLNPPLAWFWLGLLPPPTQFLIPVLFLPTIALPHSVWLSSVIRHRRADRQDVRSDEERK